jgi:nitrogen fixation/metabolism regulation signal transduction histidine kinase
LSPEVELNLSERDEETSTQLEQVDGSAALFGYRAFNIPESPSTVIGAPARADELTLGRRRRDLGVLVLFATAVGALAALWLSGIVARQLSSPIGTLRQAALSLAGGARTLSFDTEPMAEFSPVFNAFRRMAADLNSSRSALEEAKRRTSAVLRNVASGVVAVDRTAVCLWPIRAESVLGGAGASVMFTTPPAAISAIVERFLKSTDDETELSCRWTRCNSGVR